jgi:glycosyltransferase involved in cell wall biosynthesis
LAQEVCFPYEIIVGDDGSVDGTREIVRGYAARYPDRIRAILQPTNTGGSKNNLEVHAAARGEFVAHVDGDDIAFPGKLQAQADALDAEPELVAVWHRVDYFDDRGGFCSGRTADLSSYAEGRVTFADAIRLGFVGVYSSLMYRRAVRTPISVERDVLDVYFTWDLLSKGPGRVLDAVLGRYRVASKNSITKTTRRKRTIAVDHAGEFLERFPARRRDFAIWALSHAVLWARLGQSRRVVESLAFVLKTRSWVGPLTLVSNMRRMRQTQVQWRRLRKVLDAPAEPSIR